MCTSCQDICAKHTMRFAFLGTGRSFLGNRMNECPIVVNVHWHKNQHHIQAPPQWCQSLCLNMAQVLVLYSNDNCITVIINRNRCSIFNEQIVMSLPLCMQLGALVSRRLTELAGGRSAEWQASLAFAFILLVWAAKVPVGWVTAGGISVCVGAGVGCIRTGTPYWNTCTLLQSLMRGWERQDVWLSWKPTCLSLSLEASVKRTLAHCSVA